MQETILHNSNDDELQLEELQSFLAVKDPLRELGYNFPSIRWTQSFMRLLATRESCYPLLIRAFRFVPRKFEFDFLCEIFQNRDAIPQKILYELWYNNITNRCFVAISDLKWWIHERLWPATHLADTFEEQILRAGQSFTSPLLIDIMPVCQLYCMARKPGWELLRHIPGMRKYSTKRISTALQQAIKTDSVATFCINRDMTGQGISYSLLMAIVKAGAEKIFRHLLEHNEIPSSVITLPELCCMLVAQQPDDISVPFLAILENLNPGMLKGIHDALGRNLFWFSIYNHAPGTYTLKNRLTQFLLGKGCNPQNANPLGVTWQEAIDIAENARH